MNLKISLKELAKRGRLPFYIDNDGRPIGETPCHVENVCYMLEPLQEWFRADSQVFVAGAMVLHYEKGRRDRYLSPDICVVRMPVPKVINRIMAITFVWEEGSSMDLVIEITSEWTRDEDQIEKRTIYQDILRVQEYFLFDPLHDYLVPPLQGLRFQVPAAGQTDPARAWPATSKVLGLHLEADGDLLRLYDPAARRRLLIPPEVREALRKAQQDTNAIKADIKRLRREREELLRQREQLCRETEELLDEQHSLRRRQSGDSLTFKQRAFLRLHPVRPAAMIESPPAPRHDAHRPRRPPENPPCAGSS